jgi:hypothetical protein
MQIAKPVSGDIRREDALFYRLQRSWKGIEVSPKLARRYGVIVFLVRDLKPCISSSRNSINKRFRERKYSDDIWNRKSRISKIKKAFEEGEEAVTCSFLLGRNIKTLAPPLRIETPEPLPFTTARKWLENDKETALFCALEKESL